MTDDLVGLERWPGYEQQSWSERFAELDRRAAINTERALRATAAFHIQAAARIEALEAEKAGLLGQINTMANDLVLMGMARDRYAEVLRTFLTEYVQLVESGDAGFWDVEKEPKVIAARALLGDAPHAD